MQISPDNLDVGVKEPLQHPSDTLDVKDMPLISPLHDVVSTSTFAVPDNQIFLDICAGSTRPLSEAILSLGGDVLSFDILLDSSMDSLRDDSHEQVLRICSSAQVQIRFSFTTLCPLFQVETVTWTRSQGSPHTGGIAGRSRLSSQELLQVQESYLMLFRCITCLTLIFKAGGHVHLEQPPSAMSWLEDCVVQFLKLISAWCVVMAACAYDADWYKSWMFASSFQAISGLGALCDHPPNSHQSIRGTRAGPGEFLSRQTACYPAALASKFAQIVIPLFSRTSHDWQWKDRHSLLPIKGRYDPPLGQEDGAGVFSSLDWSLPDRDVPDTFKELRQGWVQKILKLQLDKQTFPEEVVQVFRQMLIAFFEQQGYQLDWAIREHQPVHLQILRSFQLMKDADTALFSSLLEGVVTGFCHNIPPSKCMPPNECDINMEVPLSALYSNWNSADSDLVLTKSLVQEEIDKGWVFEFEGTIEEAQARWPLGVSLGKLGIAHSDGRAPRLVLDNTVCGLNPRCLVPERSTLPTCKDILRTFPIREFQGDHIGFSVDVKAAHKRIVLHDQEQGLVGFTLDGRLFFYRVTLFGAVFSAHWWGRLGGFLLRIFHRIIWWVHTGFLYVDDYFFTQCWDMMPVSATMVCLFCQICKIPISWGKCELGGSLQWIGWTFHLNAGYIEVPERKISKLLGYISEMKRSSRTTRRHLEKLIGLAMWITQLWP